MGDVMVRVQQTPNPNSILFHVDQTVTEERMQQFNSLEEAEGAPLAQALFGIANVESVFFMPTSITVSKSAGGEWGVITPAAEEAIRSHFAT
ncbi:MAG: NifU N-terminal domain-containing protein [Gemmatimonadetes bacterium]|nr:NifU N-terminal domain-containing protein [Gemmatimonadota bacterium]